MKDTEDHSEERQAHRITGAQRFAIMVAGLVGGTVALIVAHELFPNFNIYESRWAGGGYLFYCTCWISWNLDILVPDRNKDIPDDPSSDA